MQWLPCSANRRTDSVTTARFGHSTVCIPGTGSVWATTLVVVFGGVSYTDGESAAEQHAALSDVAVLQTEVDLWFAPQVSTADGSSLPEARAYHSAAAVDRRMYVFGGHVLSYDPDQNKKRRRFFNDLWCLDTDTWMWERLDTTRGAGAGAVPGVAPEQPPRRDMATLTRAGPAHLLLFGGRLENGRVAGDAWVLDLNSLSWSQLKMPGPTPPPRKMHAAVYATNRVVLFGGERDTGVLDDLWTLKGADGSEPAKWTQIRLRPAPSGRFGHAMAASGSRLAVFGGCLDQSSLLSFSRTYVQCNELWVLDMATFSWHRVEPPDGVTPVIGVPLHDPNLLNHLQQQAAALPPAPSGQPHQPGPPQLLLLPAERMCHSLVAVGAGRLLLVGGRKRDGICGEPWWLCMGPDNLTPALTAPPPEVVAAAAAAAASQSLPPSPSPRRSSSSADVVPRAASAAGPPPPPPPPPPVEVGGQQQPVTGPPSLLQNLLRKSAPPHGDATQAPAGVAPVAVASAAAGPAGRPGRGSGSGLDPTSTSARPSAAAAAAAAAVAPAVAGRGMALSKSAESIREAALPGDGGAAGAQPVSPVLQQHAPPSPAGPGHHHHHHQHNQHHHHHQHQQQQQVLERPADKGPTPLGRVGWKLPSLLPSSLTASMRRGDGSQQHQQQAQQQQQHPGSGSGSRTPSVSAQVASPSAGQSGPMSLAPVSPPATRGSGGSASGAALTGALSGPSLSPAASPPPDVVAAWDQLRSRLGLSALHGSAHTAAGPTLRGPGSSGGMPGAPPPPPPSTSSELLDPVLALTALGHSLATSSVGGGSGACTAVGAGAGAGARPPRPGSVEAEAAVARARRHLACCAAEQLAVGQLPVLLADCQALLKARGAAAWSALESESWPTTRGANGSGGGGEAQPPAPPPDLAVLAAYVSSCSHPLAGLRAEELRLGDVGDVLASYRSLVLSGEGSMGGAAVEAVGA